VTVPVKRGRGMKRIIAVEPGEWIILPCILETDECYYRVDFGGFENLQGERIYGKGFKPARL
jgi:hypothetical protein